MQTLPDRAANDNTDNYAMSLNMMLPILDACVESACGPSATFAEKEALLLRASNDAARLKLERDLQKISDGLDDNLSIDGIAYRRHTLGTVNYHTLCGTVSISRSTYRRLDERNGATVVPLELVTGLVENATPALAYRVALGYAQGPGRHAEEQMQADYRQPPSRSTLERIGKRIGTQARDAAPRVEPMMRAAEVLPKNAGGISVGLDRTSVPMEEMRAEDAPAPKNRRQRTTPYVRAAPPRIDVNYRMAYVGTVSVVDSQGNSLVTRRYAASAGHGPAEILARMMADVERAKQQQNMLPVGVMQDGAPEMWNLVRDALEAESSVVDWYEGIDRYHLNERLGEILRITESVAAKREITLSDWNYRLDRDDGAIERIAKWLSRQIRQTLDEKDIAILKDHRTFIMNNRDRMRYASLIRVGLPCGSGATEGACKSVVMIRAKGCGQRWHDDGVNAALTLRSIYMSERLGDFWKHFSSDYRAEVRAA